MESNKRDEIDLKDVFFGFIMILKKNIIIISICLTLGLITGYIYSTSSQKVYESQMIINSDLLSLPIAEELIDNLSSLISQNDHHLAAQKMDVSLETVNSIVRLRISKSLENKSKQKFEEDKIFLAITAQALNMKAFEELQHGIIYYLENNSYIKTRVEQRKRFLIGMISEIDKELKHADELKAQLLDGNYFIRAKGKLTIDPSEVYDRVVQLQEKRLEYQNELETVANVELFEPFIGYTQPTWPKKSVSLAMGIFLGLFIATSIIVIKAINKELKIREAQKSKPA